ncbi:hypothetical protein BGZ81_011482, partial [Podila clonocystis]
MTMLQQPRDQGSGPSTSTAYPDDQDHKESYFSDEEYEEPYEEEEDHEHGCYYEDDYDEDEDDDDEEDIYGDFSVNTKAHPRARLTTS